MIIPIIFQIFVTNNPHINQMENKLYRLVFLTVLIFFAVGVQAQRRNARYVEYINKYSDLAVEQMKLHKIPASITLAQGLLESGAGNSQLARKSNNHFGIKCGGSWRGAHRSS